MQQSVSFEELVCLLGEVYQFPHAEVIANEITTTDSRGELVVVWQGSSFFFEMLIEAFASFTGGESQAQQLAREVAENPQKFQPKRPVFFE